MDECTNVLEWAEALLAADRCVRARWRAVDNGRPAAETFTESAVAVGSPVPEWSLNATPSLQHKEERQA